MVVATLSMLLIMQAELKLPRDKFTLSLGNLSFFVWKEGKYDYQSNFEQ